MKTPVFRLAIVGSSALTNSQAETAREVIMMFLYWFRGCYACDDSDLMMVSGGAPGVDSIAEEVAGSMGVASCIYRPDVLQWEDRDGRRGFKSRNLTIAQNCDYLLCIRSRTSQTYGSGWTADQAEKLGIKPKRVYV